MRMPAEQDSGGSYRPIQPDEQFVVLVVGEAPEPAEQVEESYYAAEDRKHRRRIRKELKS